MKKNIQCYIFGGAFNPPTNGHRKILQALVDKAATIGNTEVWLLPSGNKNKKKIGVPNKKRLEYCEALIKSIESHDVVLRIERLEIDDTAKTNKVETVQRLSSFYPWIEFIWVYGSDSFETIHLWDGDWLIDNTQMICIPRDSNTLSLPDNVEILDAESGNMPSSTTVRNHIKSGLPFKSLVPKTVFNIIEESLYKD